MILSNTGLFKSVIVCLLAITLTASCDQGVQVKVGYTHVETQPNGCVAHLWANTSNPLFSYEATLQRAEPHMNGEYENSQISTPLMAAVVRNEVSQVRSILLQNIDLEETNAAGCTALIWAAALGKPDIQRMLLDAGADTETTDAAGRTPLMFAVISGNLETVSMLIEGGANVRATQSGGINERGRTALHNALNRRDNLAIVKLLITKGVDRNAVDEHGRSALDIAIQNAAIRGEEFKTVDFLQALD